MNLTGTIFIKTDAKSNGNGTQKNPFNSINSYYKTIKNNNKNNKKKQ